MLQEGFFRDQSVTMTIEYFQQPFTYYTGHIDVLDESYLVHFLLPVRLTIAS